MLTRLDPFREALSLRRAMDQLFERSFVNTGLVPNTPNVVAPMDVCETSNGYEIDIALPGAQAEDIELMIDQNTLTIRGRFTNQDEHRDQPQGEMQEGQSQQENTSQTEQQARQSSEQAQASSQDPQQTQLANQTRAQRHRRGHNWLAREIVYGTFERTVTFPKAIDPDNIQTFFRNGILTILVPVSEASRPRRINLTSTDQSQQSLQDQQRQQGQQGQQAQQKVSTGQS